MEIKFFDVSHGFCAKVIANNGNIMLFDCGHNSQTGFRPSEHLRLTGCTGIERMFFLNYDEDHLSDLPALRKTLPIKVFHRNKSISSDELRKLKIQTGTIKPGMQALLDFIANSGHDVYGYDEFPGFEIKTFWNPYPLFKDTNNLSMVVFLHWNSIHVIFPGDLEKAGWESLLSDRVFRSHLSRVNIFVASHHGRLSGYCEKVFDYCHPDLIIISDESIKYNSQDVDYRKHSKGVPWESGEIRYVLTTRKDGLISINDLQGYTFFFNTSA